MTTPQEKGNQSNIKTKKGEKYKGPIIKTINTDSETDSPLFSRINLRMSQRFDVFFFKFTGEGVYREDVC